MKNINKNIIKDIKEYMESERLTIFVGSGVSILSGCPSYTLLIKKLADELGYSYKHDKNGNPKFTKEEFLNIPEEFYKKNKKNYLDKINKLFNYKNFKPNKIHNLLFSLKPKYFITTNFDELLEIAANEYKYNFSVINSDSSVSNKGSSSFIIKAHGDFSSRKIVLKQKDFLDYEKNYSIISNDIKFIFSNNLVIFIGYSLNDHNIRSILDEVKNAQSNTFVKPIFLANENDNRLDKEYLNGVRVINCNKYCGYKNNHDYNNDNNYLNMYEKTLEKIIESVKYYKPNKLSSKKDMIEYIYKKISNLKNFAYIRREDFNNIFKEEYNLNNYWEFEYIRKSNENLNFFDDFSKHWQEYKNINEKYYNAIKIFINKCKINIENGIPKININNLYFLSDYNEMDKFCKSEYENLYDKYKKAYYLAKLGNLQESYNNYTEIIKKAEDLREYDIYSLSQLNRCILTSIINYYISPNNLNFLSENKKFDKIDDSFIKNMNYEMKYNQNQINEWIFSTYPFLRDLFIDKNFIIKYNEKSCNIYESIQKNTQYIGLSILDELKQDMLEVEKFIYDNMILYEEFTNYKDKNYVKKVLIDWLKDYKKEINNKNIHYNFNLTDIILVAKNFNKYEIDYLIDRTELKNVIFEDCSNLEEHINKQITHKYQFNSSLVEKNYNDEVSNLLYISSYFLKECDNNFKIKIIEFIIDDINILDSYKISLIEKWIKVANTKKTYNLIEKFLIKKLKNSIKRIKNTTSENHDDVIGNIKCVGLVNILQISLLLECIGRQEEININNNDISNYIIDNKEDIIYIINKENLNYIDFCFNCINYLLNDKANKIIESIKLNNY